MKKLSTAILALMLAAPLSLGACGSQTQEPAQTDAAEQTETTTQTQTTESEAKTEIEEETTADEQIVEAQEAEGEAAQQVESISGASAGSKSSNTDNLVNWGIKIAVPDGATGVLKGDEYYIYTKKGESFPYILVCVYNMDMTGKDFLKEFTDYMKGNHSDLKVVEEAKSVKIGDKDCTQIQYSYAIEGYPALDTRVVTPANGRVYMFATKSIDELGLSTGDLFEQVIKDAEIYKAK